MNIDFFGFKKRKEIKKQEVIKELQVMLDKAHPSSNAYIQGWDESQAQSGRPTRIDYRTLENLYKRESWVRACIDAIQRATTSNGYKLVSKDKNDSKDLSSRETKDILEILEKPNDNDSFYDILSEIIIDLHLYGDAYVEIVRNRQGIPVALYNMYAPSIRVRVDKRGKVVGYVQFQTGGISPSTAKNMPQFKTKNVIHFRLPNPGNSVYGLSPLESLALPLETDIYAQKYNLNFFKNDATPRLHVSLGNKTSLPQLNRTREYFNAAFRGAGNAHKTLVTEGEVDISVIGTKPNDMEFLNQRKFSRNEVCSVFGVPPMKIGIFEDVNRASARESDKTFKSEKIIPLQRMVARKLNNSLISSFNKPRVKFEFNELDLRDKKEVAEIDKIDIESGVLLVNEVRRSRGLQPLSDKQLNLPKPNNKKPSSGQNSNADYNDNAAAADANYNRQGQ